VLVRLPARELRVRVEPPGLLMNPNLASIRENGWPEIESRE
jgi:hypothetical protein